MEIGGVVYSRGGGEGSAPASVRGGQGQSGIAIIAPVAQINIRIKRHNVITEHELIIDLLNLVDENDLANRIQTALRTASGVNHIVSWETDHFVITSGRN